MTQSAVYAQFQQVAQILWGPPSGATQFQIPASVIAGAQQTGQMGGAFLVGALAAYLAPAGTFGGYPVLNPVPGATATGWSASPATITLNTSPPAGCPTPQCMTMTPNGSSNSPIATTPGGFTVVYPGVSYVVSSAFRPAAATGSPGLTLAMAWFDSSDANLLEIEAFVLPTFTVGVWNQLSASFTAPNGAYFGIPFAGWTGSAVAAADVLSISAINVTTPYS